MEEVIGAEPLPFHPLKWVALITGPPIAVLDHRYPVSQTDVR
jgi:hypothetical protein